MKKNTLLKFLFLSLVLSSCGLIERFKTPEQPNDTLSSSENKSTESSDDLFAQTASESQSASSTDTNKTDVDDLFGDSMNESAKTSGSDAPTDGDLKSLENEFSGSGPRESVITESKSDTPVVVSESIPEIKEEVATAPSTGGTVQNYKVQKGETLMQIAFKLYGDIGKWKDIKNMNRDKITNNTSLRANTTLKYMAPETPFVWNPVGVPYMIKSGDTLGIISNSVYATPKKWKSIWENNKPLIKNPNVIFAGFTLYYKKNPGMANYVQPASAQPKAVAAAAKAEEVMIEKMMEEKMMEETPTETQSSASAAPAIQETQIDEAIQQQSAPVRETNELTDEAVLAPAKASINTDDSLPMIDEEIQNLE